MSVTYYRVFGNLPSKKHWLTISILGQNLQLFYEQTLYLTTLKVMYPKFTSSCRVEISIGNKHVYSNDVYIYPQILILVSKQSLVHRFYKRNKKNPVIFQRHWNICNNITLHAFIFYSAGKHVCFYINRQPHA